MKTVTLALSLFAPAVVMGQSSVSASTSASASASVEASRDSGRYHAPSRFKASTRTQLEARVSRSRAEGRPYRPLIARIAEAEAKGASDAQVLASTARYNAQLDAAFDAMVRAGRTRPSDEECKKGASALARGYTAAQLEAVARSAPGDRSLVVAFSTLAELSASGVPVTRAVAEVRSHLESRASDAAIAALSADVAAHGAVNAAHGGHSAAAGAATTVGAAAGSAGSVGAAATGAAGAAAGAGSIGAGAAAGVVGGIGRP
jgi:hypothetical protein